MCVLTHAMHTHTFVLLTHAMCSGTPPSLSLEAIAREFHGNHPMGPLTPPPLSPSLLTLCTKGSFEFGEVDSGMQLSSCSSMHSRDMPLPDMQVRMPVSAMTRLLGAFLLEGKCFVWASWTVRADKNFHDLLLCVCDLYSIPCSCAYPQHISMLVLMHVSSKNPFVNPVSFHASDATGVPKPQDQIGRAHV